MNSRTLNGLLLVVGYIVSIAGFAIWASVLGDSTGGSIVLLGSKD